MLGLGSFSARGVRVSRKEMRKAVIGYASDQPNAMLALSVKERFFLSALAVHALKESETILLSQTPLKRVIDFLQIAVILYPI